MHVDIGAKRPIDGDQVFVVAQCIPSYSEPSFVLLYDAVKKRRAKRNIQKIAPIAIVAALGLDAFNEVRYPGWGSVWFRTSRIRCIRALTEKELVNSSKAVGSLVLFIHDADPEDDNAGFSLFGMHVSQLSQLLESCVNNQSL